MPRPFDDSHAPGRRTASWRLPDDARCPIGATSTNRTVRHFGGDRAWSQARRCSATRGRRETHRDQRRVLRRGNCSERCVATPRSPERVIHLSQVPALFVGQDGCESRRRPGSRQPGPASGRRRPPGELENSQARLGRSTSQTRAHDASPDHNRSPESKPASACPLSESTIRRRKPEGLRRL